MKGGVRKREKEKNKTKKRARFTHHFLPLVRLEVAEQEVVGDGGEDTHALLITGVARNPLKKRRQLKGVEESIIRGFMGEGEKRHARLWNDDAVGFVVIRGLEGLRRDASPSIAVEVHPQGSSLGRGLGLRGLLLC